MPSDLEYIWSIEKIVVTVVNGYFFYSFLNGESFLVHIVLVISNRFHVFCGFFSLGKSGRFVKFFKHWEMV